MEEDAVELVLHASRRKWAGVFAIGLLFVVSGSWLITTGEGLWAWLSALFGGACGVAGLVSLLRPGSLHLTRDGFYVQALGRGSYASRWDEADHFRMWSSAYASVVMFDWTPPSSRSGSGALPDTYGKKATHLAGLMQTWRDRAVGTGGTDGSDT